FTAVTGVRFPVGVPNFNKPLLKNSKGLFLSFNAMPAISAFYALANKAAFVCIFQMLYQFSLS
ncbi:hypothetical protein, partial [Neisseria mucosa]|uniref:hypothetical protein n=1 Tax=Neisseria mucosa TaxID=488 RepID=UPI000666965F